MANFNSSVWYQITVPFGPSSAFVGTSLFHAGKGAAFVSPPNITDDKQLWQFIAVSSTSGAENSYALRCKAGGPTGYMVTEIKTGDQEIPGATAVALFNYTLVTNPSVYWQIKPWQDGTFYMTNSQNGSDWHLTVDEYGHLVMGSNITAPQPNQALSFHTLGSIDDQKYSTVDSFVSMTTMAMTKTTGSSTSTTISASSANTSSIGTGNNKSHSNAAAIGGAVSGVVAVIALLLLTFLLFRRRKNRKSQGSDNNHNFKHENTIEVVAPSYYGHELPAQQRYMELETPIHQNYELPSNSSRDNHHIRELPGDDPTSYK